jgi:hypothetical protein
VTGVYRIEKQVEFQATRKLTRADQASIRAVQLACHR